MGTFVKAERKRAKARIGLVGPDGSGKTMSALKLACGIVGPTGRIAVIDFRYRLPSRPQDLPQQCRRIGLVRDTAALNGARHQ